LLKLAPTAADRALMLAQLDEGLGGRRVDAPPAEFRTAVAALGDPALASDLHVLRLAMACGDGAARERVVQLAVDTRLPTAYRVACVEALGQIGDASCVPRLLPLLALEEQHDVEIAVLHAIARFDDDRIMGKILAEYPRYSDKLKGICRQVLFSRAAWAMGFLKEVAQKKFDPKSVSPDELRGLDVFADPKLDQLVRKHWGRVTGGTPEEKLADVRRLNNDLRAAAGNLRDGYAIFKEHCAKCHKLFGEGETIGPDLTTANRADRDYLLTNLVDPSNFIRVEYLSVQIVTGDGRILTGLIAAETPTNLTLVNSKAEKITLSRGDIEEMNTSQVSQMPEDVLKPLSPQQLRDLFAYLQSNGPVNAP
jgi:putative heme-binding domain-containing protein